MFIIILAIDRLFPQGRSASLLTNEIWVCEVIEIYKLGKGPGFSTGWLMIGFCSPDLFVCYTQRRVIT